MIWRGTYVEVGVNAQGEAVWGWHACVVCAHELVDGESIQRAVGPDCLRRRTPEQLERLKRAARAIDRAAYREHLAGRQRAAEIEQRLKRVVNPPRGTDAPPEGT